MGTAFAELDDDVLARVNETQLLLGVETSEAGVRYAMAALPCDDADRFWRMWCFALVRTAEQGVIDARRDA
jgi:hypothetical protein